MSTQSLITISASLARVSAQRSRQLSRQDRAILLAVLYADLFDYALLEEELYQRLVRVRMSRATFESMLPGLAPTYLSKTNGFWTWKGREHLVGLRQHREQVSKQLWPIAERYVRWLARVPFIRVVALSGSIAVGNATAHSDIDLFCITDARRLWLARLGIVPLSRLTRWFSRAFPQPLCPNYIVAQDALEVQDRSLFTAHEIVQSLPLWGNGDYQQFLEANTWVEGYLPQNRPQQEVTRAHGQGFWLKRVLEGALRGRLGDALNHGAFRFFTAFCRRRAERRGWSWSQLANAYQPGRYTVPEGGYVRVIQQRFVRHVHKHLGQQVSRRELEWLFPMLKESLPEPYYDWEDLFIEEYGDR